mgnify:CR=1 FL=1
MASASELQKAVDKLLLREPGWRKATQPPAMGPRPGGVGVGRPASGTTALELIEEDASTRQYYAPVVLRTSDGLFTIEVEPIRQISLRGNIPFRFAEPPPT